MEEAISITSYELSPDDQAPEPVWAHRYHQPVSPVSSNESPGSIDANLSMFRSNMPWEDNDGYINGCWNDAFTASTVLSLLHKEPISPQRGHRRPSLSISSSLIPRQPPRCVVCSQAIDRSSLPAPRLAANCDHSAIRGVQICLPCLRRCLDIQFSSKGPESLSCPLCQAQLSHDEVRKWATPETFQTVDSIKTQRALEEDSEFIRCVRTGCGYGQLHAGGRENPIAVCEACGTRMCFVHRDIWHEGLSCDEYDLAFTSARDDGDNNNNGEVHAKSARHTTCKWLDRISGRRAYHKKANSGMKKPSALNRLARVNLTTEDLRSQRTIWQIAKPCPRCNAITEKEGGCKFMRCMCPFFSHHTAAGSLTSLNRYALLAKMVLGLWWTLAARTP